MIAEWIYHFLYVIIYIIAKSLFSYKAIGAEYIPKRGSAILASNHASYFDPPFVGLGVWRRINYLAKKELFKNRFINYFLFTIVKTIPVDREQMDKHTLKKIYQLLKEDEILLLFPEGTRTYSGDLMEPKMGIGMIAYATKVPVIPVYVNGSYKIFPRNSKLIRLRPCKVFFGPPVNLETYYDQKKSKELYRDISLRIMEGIRELKQKSEEE
jgi:1-acyl-sn-glycerol-3-phosphate acyltransferase